MLDHFSLFSDLFSLFVHYHYLIVIDLLPSSLLSSCDPLCFRVSAFHMFLVFVENKLVEFEPQTSRSLCAHATSRPRGRGHSCRLVLLQLRDEPYQQNKIRNFMQIPKFSCFFQNSTWPHMSSKRKSQPTKIMDESPLFRAPQMPPPHPGTAPMLFNMTTSASSPSHVDSLSMSYAQLLKTNEDAASNFKSASNLHEMAQLEYIRMLAHQQQQQQVEKI